MGKLSKVKLGENYRKIMRNK